MEVVRDKDSSYCLCGTCQKTVFMQTITTSYCRECGGLIASEHRPAHKLCRACAEKQHRCAQCGKPLS